MTKRQGILDGWKEQHSDKADMDVFLPKAQDLQLG